MGSCQDWMATLRLVSHPQQRVNLSRQHLRGEERHGAYVQAHVHGASNQMYGGMNGDA